MRNSKIAHYAIFLIILSFLDCSLNFKFRRMFYLNIVPKMFDYDLQYDYSTVHFLISNNRKNHWNKNRYIVGMVNKW